MQTENIDTLPPVEETPAEGQAPVAPQVPDTPPAPVPRPPFYKKALFWELTVGIALFLGVLALILVALRTSPAANPDNTAEATLTEETEETLPPPEGNPIGMGDFYMDGDYLACLTAPSALGIDVSEWQGEIDWQQVKEAGVEFAMIRAGWRGSVQGVLTEDTYARANFQGAIDAGIQVGAYFFSQAVSVEEAEEEARYLLGILRDYPMDMPVVFDWEYIDADSRTANVDARTLTDCTKAFCTIIKDAGYQPMVYFNINHSYDRVYLRELTDYPFWLAYYDTALDYPYKIDMWQYTETGSVPGIEGNVDIDLLFSWE